MNLILETDIGRDPDDFFALLYLVEAGVDIRAITISPGDPDQVQLARTLCKQLGLDIPIGVGKLNRDKSSVGGAHVDFVKRYGSNISTGHDGHGGSVIADTVQAYPDAQFLCIGPLNSVGAYLSNGGIMGRTTMQGGFAGYHLHDYDVVRLDKFENQPKVATFNLGGDKKSAQLFTSTTQVSSRQFVGKNVCHTILYDTDIHDKVKSVPVHCRAREIFIEVMDIYMTKQTHKAFHDPTAAVCHLHPEIGTWIQGKMVYNQGLWGAEQPGLDQILVDIDRASLWNHIVGV